MRSMLDRSPSIARRTFLIARSAMRRLASTVLLPMCGTRDDVRERAQIVIRSRGLVRLAREHVERRTRQSAASERVVQRELVHDGAAGRIDQPGARRHQRQPVRIDEARILRAAGDVQADEIGLADRLGEIGGDRGDVRARRLARRPRVADDAHPEARRGNPRHRDRDRARTDQRERLAFELQPFLGFPASVPDADSRRHQVPGRPADHHHRQLGHRLLEHVRRVCAQDPGVGRLAQVDAVVADAESRNHPASRQRGIQPAAVG